MKKIFLILVLTFTQFLNAMWYTDFKEAKKMALATNKLLIVDFWATWCGPCKKMDFDSWDNVAVTEVLTDSYIKVKVDIDVERELASQYNVSSIPNMFIMDANGKAIHSFLGYKDANELKAELIKYAYSTEFLFAESLSYSQHQDYNSAVRLGLRYMDYSCYLPKEIKRSIVNVADKYFIAADKFNNSQDENFILKKEKLELLKLYEFVYILNFDKLQKKLQKIDVKTVAESNINYYYFLQLFVAKGLKNEQLAKNILDDTKSLDDFQYFIDKVDFILSKNQS